MPRGERDITETGRQLPRAGEHRPCAARDAAGAGFVSRLSIMPDGPCCSASKGSLAVIWVISRGPERLVRRSTLPIWPATVCRWRSLDRVLVFVMARLGELDAVIGDAHAAEPDDGDPERARLLNHLGVTLY